jgi:hypothetical protein
MTPDDVVLTESLNLRGVAKMPNRTVMSLAAIAIVFAGGCGEKATTISGKVTYNGQPVEMGAITFTPTDGKGPILAARILDGAYDIPNAMPGSRTVEIRGMRKVNFGRSSEEAARLAAERQAAGDPMGGHVAEAADYIPTDAEGNNKTVEIEAGDQTMDFDLKGPPRT